MAFLMSVVTCRRAASHNGDDPIYLVMQATTSKESGIQKTKSNYGIRSTRLCNIFLLLRAGLAEILILYAIYDSTPLQTP